MNATKLIEGKYYACTWPGTFDKKWLIFVMPKPKEGKTSPFGRRTHCINRGGTYVYTDILTGALSNVQFRDAKNKEIGKLISQIPDNN